MPGGDFHPSDLAHLQTHESRLQPVRAADPTGGSRDSHTPYRLSARPQPPGPAAHGPIPAWRQGRSGGILGCGRAARSRIPAEPAMRRLFLLLAAIALAPTAASADVVLPAGFEQTRVVAGITGATAMEVAPDGRIFVCEQTGALRVVKEGSLLPRPFVTLKVDSFWERGLIGVELDPCFPRRPYVYLCYVTPDPYPHHRISRFTVAGDVAAAGSEVVLFEGDDQTRLGGEVPAGHQGGAIHFGTDGKLYVALGEQTAGRPSQDLGSLLGKMLRLNPDGTIPEDNPFARAARGKYRAIWALGLRNPFTFAVQPGTGRIFINDVGGNREEVNEGFAGANYGWPTVEHGPTADPRFRGPVYHYPTSSVTGGAFCPADFAAFPPKYRGRYFFMDFVQGWMKVLDPDRPAAAADFAAGLARPVDLKFAPDGGLYYLSRDMWVKDKDFKPGTGALYRIRYDPAAAPRVAAPPPSEPPPAPYPPILPPAGTYTGPIIVRLHLGRDADTLRYTTDGSAPTAASAPYSGPFRLATSATVTARPFRGGASVGPPVTAAYTIAGERPYGLSDRPEARGLNVPLDPARLPRRLSETGLFTSLADLAPSPGVVPYTINSPLWSDGARKRRWIALPGGERVGFRKAGEWTFPRGTVLVKHFELPVDESDPSAVRWLETRLLVVAGEGVGYGVTYRWRPDRSDADLLADGATDEVAIRSPRGTRSQAWTYPGRDDCLKCHTGVAGFVLGPKARQLNGEYRYPATGVTDNQLRTWNYLGMFDPPLREAEIPGLDRLVAVGDVSAGLEHRVRSYLDANCMHCHRPGANIPAAFDARFDTPPAERKILDAPTVSDSLGIDRPRIVAPGDPARSMLYQRMVQPARYKMPPLARNVVDAEAAAVIAEWIRGQPTKGRSQR